MLHIMKRRAVTQNQSEREKFGVWETLLTASGMSSLDSYEQRSNVSERGPSSSINQKLRGAVVPVPEIAEYDPECRRIFQPLQALEDGVRLNHLWMLGYRNVLVKGMKFYVQETTHPGFHDIRNFYEILKERLDHIVQHLVTLGKPALLFIEVARGKSQNWGRANPNREPGDWQICMWWNNLYGENTPPGKPKGAAELILGVREAVRLSFKDTCQQPSNAPIPTPWDGGGATPKHEVYEVLTEHDGRPLRHCMMTVHGQVYSFEPYLALMGYQLPSWKDDPSFMHPDLRCPI